VLLVEELSATVKALTTGFQRAGTLLKQVGKEAHKICKKQSSQRSKRRGTGSNLTKPQKVSDELNTFFGNETGTQMRRSEITKALNVYAEAKNIKAADNRRVVVIDPPLAQLMNNPDRTDNPAEKDQLELFQMLKHLKHHISGDAEVNPAVLVGATATSGGDPVAAEAVAAGV
jgi:chromatin remodeling complex protein RSC6